MPSSKLTHTAKEEERSTVSTSITRSHWCSVMSLSHYKTIAGPFPSRWGRDLRVLELLKKGPIIDSRFLGPFLKI